MKPILFAALAALPLAFTGCGTYVGVDGGPGVYGPGYYDGGVGVVDVGYYGYDHGGYHHSYSHYDSGYHNAVASRNFSHAGGTRVASASRASASHSSGASHSASASVGGGHIR